jgi:hypothetical protein
MGDKVYRELLEKLQEIEIIDTHEHIMSQEEVKEEPLHLFRIFENSYARLDFITAGMPPEIWQNDNPEEIWEVWKRYQEPVGLTCFTRNIIRALKDLYGLEGNVISEENWREVSERVEVAYERENWYDYVLRRRANFKVSFLDTFWSVEKFSFDPSLFIPVLRSNPLILGRAFVSQYPKGKVVHTTVEKLARKWGVSIKDFESYLTLIDLAIGKYKNNGAPAIKIGTAYERSLFFQKVSRDEAARLYSTDPTGLSSDDRRKLQDFMARYVIQKATEKDLPVQIHTGILARNGNILANSNPEKLNTLLLDYPDTKFVLLHFSFPYVRQVFSLAKMFPHVFLDFCWVPMLSMKAATQTLDEFFDLVPYNKLMWGGDSYRVEEAYAGACLAREVMATVLAGRINKGDMDFSLAMRISQAIFRDNAWDVYRLSDNVLGAPRWENP